MCVKGVQRNSTGALNKKVTNSALKSLQHTNGPATVWLLAYTHYGTVQELAEGNKFTVCRWASTLPSCLWSLRIFPSLLGSRLTNLHRDASSALLQLVNQWLNFTYSRTHAFRYGRQNKNPASTRIELKTKSAALAGVEVI